MMRQYNKDTQMKRPSGEATRYPLSLPAGVPFLLCGCHKHINPPTETNVNPLPARHNRAHPATQPPTRPTQHTTAPAPACAPAPPPPPPPRPGPPRPRRHPCPRRSAHINPTPLTSSALATRLSNTRLLLVGKSAATEWYTLRGMLSTRHTPVVRTDCRTAGTQARQQRPVGF
jgi:hypothetical protein